LTDVPPEGDDGGDAKSDTWHVLTLLYQGTLRSPG